MMSSERVKPKIGGLASLLQAEKQKKQQAEATPAPPFEPPTEEPADMPTGSVEKTQHSFLVASHMETEVASHDVEIAASQQKDKTTSHQSEFAASHSIENAASKPEMVASRKASKIHKVASRKRDRHSKDRLPWNNRIDVEILKKIKHFCVEQGMEQQEFVELSAIHFMEYVASHQSGKVASMLATDDRRLMMKYKCNPLIINLYLKYNPENKWKHTDDRAAVRLNETDPRIIELGIIGTQINARFKRIHSFQYYMPEIETFLEVPVSEEALETMITLARRRWEKAREDTVSKT